MAPENGLLTYIASDPILYFRTFGDMLVAN